MVVMFPNREGKVSKMKTAKAVPCHWYVYCPECGEGLTNHEGSYLWEDTADNGTTTKCMCGAVVRLPKAIRPSLPKKDN